MISTSFRVALSALLFAGALSLASTGAAQAQSVMKQCGDDWKAAKENNTTNGMKWPEFLKQCRVQKEASAPAAAPAAAPAPAPPSRTGSRADLSAEAEARASRRSPDGRRPIQLGGRSQGPLPRRRRRLGQHQGQVPYLSLRGHPLVRHNQGGRLYVRSRRWGRRLSRVEEQDGTAEADVVGTEAAAPNLCGRLVFVFACARGTSGRG